MRNIHFIGIGGVGMNALAQIAAKKGYNVSGSDRNYNLNISPYNKLIKLNISIFPQDGTGINSNLKYVIYSTAIEQDNKEFLKAKKFNIKILHRIEFLKLIIPNKAEIIAVTGTAGKSTTTGLLGWIFEYHGLNPTVYNGAPLINWKDNTNIGNIRVGDKNLWIMEADESDKSLLKLNPTHSILTNIGSDHYNIDILKKIFQQFRKQTKKIFQSKITDKIKKEKIQSILIGKHNDENIKTAMSFCIKYGLTKEIILNAIKEFKGIERRLEFIGNTKNGVKIFDDYAHNAMKIKATLDTIKNIKCHRAHVFWRPHGHSSFNNSYHDLIKIFSRFLINKNYNLYILPIYYAGGTINPKKTPQDLIKALNFKNIHYSKSYPDLKKIILSKLSNSDIIIGMGARDPEISTFTKKLLNI